MLKVAILMVIVVVIIAGITMEKQLKQKQLKHLSEAYKFKKDKEDLKHE